MKPFIRSIRKRVNRRGGGIIHGFIYKEKDKKSKKRRPISI